MRGIVKMEEKHNRILPPQTWKNSTTHFLNTIESDWYRKLCLLQDFISVNTIMFYQAKNMKTIHLPITTGAVSSPMGLGSDSKPVKIKMFNKEMYLADSMQFMLESGCRMHPDGVYYIMPSFRGEDADDRHLCQFYHSEAEIAGNLSDVMLLVEEYIKYLCVELLNKFEDLEAICGNVRHIEKMITLKEMPKITFDEAEKILAKYEDAIKYNKLGFRTLTRDGEKILMNTFDGMVWVQNYDQLAVPFYQAINPYNQKTTLNADLLFGIGEVVGCGQRHTGSQELLKALERHKVSERDYEWYIQMKERYPMETAGFGMGIERFLLWITCNDDIRNFELLPRRNGIHICP